MIEEAPILRDEGLDRRRVAEAAQEEEQLADVDARVVDGVGEALLGDADAVAVDELGQQHARQRGTVEVHEHALPDLVQDMPDLELRVEEAVDVVHLHAVFPYLVRAPALPFEIWQVQVDDVYATALRGVRIHVERE